MQLLDANRIETLVSEFCADHHLSVQLSYEMPAGYETAFGTYDVTVNTLFFNREMLKDALEYEVLFYLYHELRHAAQYLHPDMFVAQIQDSRFYVVLYNGTCYKLVENDWQECALEGDESYYTNAYLSLPYEVDANTFAYEQVKAICGDLPELRELYNAWIPEERWTYEKLKALFCQIDGALKV